MKTYQIRCINAKGNLIYFIKLIKAKSVERAIAKIQYKPINSRLQVRYV